MLGQRHTCDACGAFVGQRQEYCLTCGTRVFRPSGVVHELGVGWRRRLRWYPGDWIWPSLGALAIAAAGTAAAIAATTGPHHHSPGTLVALSPLVPIATHTVAPKPKPAPTPTPKPARETTPPTVVAKPKPKPKPAPPAGPISWPNQDGYTIVLASIPVGGGRPEANATAQRAIDAGLDPGYYVVFAGVYTSLQDAQAALAKATARFPNAYARQVSR